MRYRCFIIVFSICIGCTKSHEKIAQLSAGQETQADLDAIAEIARHGQPLQVIEIIDKSDNDAVVDAAIAVLKDRTLVSQDSLIENAKGIITRKRGRVGYADLLVCRRQKYGLMEMAKLLSETEDSQSLPTNDRIKMVAALKEYLWRVTDIEFRSGRDAERWLTQNLESSQIVITDDRRPKLRRAER